MKPLNMPMAWKLALLPAAVALSLVGGMLWLSDHLLGEHITARAEGRVTQAANQLAHQLTRSLNRRVGEIELLSRNEWLQGDPDPRRVRTELDWLRAHTPGYEWLALADTSGRVRAATDGLLEGQSVAARALFVNGARGLWLGDVNRDGVSAQGLAVAAEAIDIALPLHHDDGRLAGVLAAQVSWAWLRDLRGEVVAADVDEGLRLVLLSRTGKPLFSELPDATTAALRAVLGSAPRDGVRLRFSSGGRQQVAAVSGTAGDGRLATLGWSVVAVQDLDTALQPLTALQRSAALGGLLLALGFGTAGFALSRRLTQPYAALLQTATRRYAQGGALGGLGLAGYLDAVSAQLQRLPQPLPARAGAKPGVKSGNDDLLALLQDAERLRAVLDNVPAAVYMVDPEFCVLYWNRGAEAMFGWTAEQAQGRTVMELLRADALAPDQAPADDAPLRFEARVLRHDGSPVWGRWRLSRSIGADGALLGLVAQVRDTTDERAARQEALTLEHRLQVIAHAATDYAFVLLDDAGLVRGFDGGAERLHGHTAEQVLGQHCAVFFAAEDRATLPDHLLQQADREGRVEFEGWCERRDGSHFWGNVLLYRLGERSGHDGGADRGTGHALVTRDLSARREAELRLRENEARLAAVIHSASDAVISSDVEGRILLFNPAAERIFGRPAASLLGQRLDVLLPSAQREHHGADLARFAASRVSRRSMAAGRVRGLRADGSLLELEASISQVSVNGQQVLTAILRDVTERVQAERALAEYQRELAALAQQLMAQEKATTRRLAQALHDQLGQTLAAVRLTIDAVPADDTPRRARLEHLVDQAIREVRQVLVELRPPLLEEHGLPAALDNELRARQPWPPGMELLLDVSAALDGQRWPADVEYAAFMIAREAIGNAMRHAGAALVRVSLTGRADTLRLEVADDGSGIEAAAAGGRPGHLGMVGMRERAQAIDASFDLQSVPGEGTRVALLWEREFS